MGLRIYDGDGIPLSGGGGSVDLSAPGPIGGGTPAAGTFTTLYVNTRLEPPRLTTSARNALTSVQAGTHVYDTDENVPFQYINGAWMAKAMHRITARTTIGSVASLNISGIPQNFRDLFIQLNIRSATSSTVDILRMRLGGASLDSTSGNYHSYAVTATGGTPSWGSEQNNAGSAYWRWYVTGANAPSGQLGNTILWIRNYSAGSLVKQMLALTSGMTSTSAGGLWTGTVMGRWLNTSDALQQLTIDLNSGANFASPSEYSIWGIAA